MSFLFLSVIIHMHAVVSHSISIVVVIISLFRGNSFVSVIWVCCPCAVLFLLLKSVVFQSSLNAVVFYTVVFYAVVINCSRVSVAVK